MSWCRHLLVPFLFYALTSLQPPSFHRNDFSTCCTHFSLFILGQSPSKNGWRCAQVNFYARACARGQPTRATHVNGVVQCHRGRAPRSTIGMYGVRKTNARCLCTPLSTVEYDHTKIEKLHMSGFSRGKPEAGRNELGLCTARYESKSCC